MTNYNQCCYPKCRNESDIIYLERQLCDRCWEKICNGSDALRKKIRLPPIEVISRKPNKEQVDSWFDDLE